MGAKTSKKVRKKVSWGTRDEIIESETLEPLPEPPAPAPTDPRCPLDARQVFRLKKSWKGIKREVGQAGLEMFIRYLVDILDFWRRASASTSDSYLISMIKLFQATSSSSHLAPRQEQPASFGSASMRVVSS